MRIILDLGSGMTCKNDTGAVYNMIRGISFIDNQKHDIILKWQLFDAWGELTPLHHGVFAYAYNTAELFGYETTASVFDYTSLKFLSTFRVPFVKIACLPELHDLAREAEGVGYWPDSLVMSYGNPDHYYQVKELTENTLACIREYPAQSTTYENIHSGLLHYGISDHTTDLKLVKKYKPLLYERHFCLDDQTGPDTGPFALRPDGLRELLEAV